MPDLQDIIIIDIPSGNCAVCQNSDGLVVNTIVSDPSEPCPLENCYLVGIELNTPVSIGCRWDGTNFLDAQGHLLKPDVPEIRCAVVDSNSIVINFALAQTNIPWQYENNTLVPIQEEQVVKIGYYWTGTGFIPNEEVTE